MERFLGIAGLPGQDQNFQVHAQKYSNRHPDVRMPIGMIGHDAAVALIEDGRIRYAVEEERLNRLKHTMGMPENAIRRVKEEFGDGLQLSYYFDPTENGKSALIGEYQRAESLDPDTEQAIASEYMEIQENVSLALRPWPNVERIDHHMAHAASAFYPSGFDRALICVVDGGGELSSTSIFMGTEQGIEPIARLPLTGSLGYLYMGMTVYLGFEALEDEYKVMGLAAYSDEDEYRSFFEGELKWDEAGFTIPSLLVRGKFLVYRESLGMWRQHGEPIEPRHIAIAASLQKCYERTLMNLLERYNRNLGARRLCLAGGCALNCAANGVIDRSRMFDEIFVQPASGDAGAALGAALTQYYGRHPRAERFRQEHVYLGPSYSDEDIERALASHSDHVAWTEPGDFYGEVARCLSEGQVVGWYQGAMEFGPRALGNRSILADPRRKDMKDIVNKAVKKREEFRPFAPSVTLEAANEFFELPAATRQYEFMTVAVRAKPNRAKEIPSVVHVDGTARVHVVRKEVNPRYWELITRFGRETGVAVVLNTSFNVKGEAIVCTPEEAIRCFLSTGIDRLAIGNKLVSKR
jgi:carbamoyltransferase